MEEFFKQLVGLAGYGLVGIVIVMVIVLGYLAYKRPNNKFGILVLAGFCLVVIVIFAFAGIGVVKENKKIESEKQSLSIEKKQLTEKTKNLAELVKLKDAKLDIVRFQNLVLTDGTLPKDSLTKFADIMTRNFEFLSSGDTGQAKVAWNDLAGEYRGISEKLKSNQTSTGQALLEIRNSYKKIKITN
jgi:hypothetical protein